MRHVLAIRDVRLLLLGQLVSQAGDWLYDVALLVYVLDATGSAAWVAAAGLVRLVPWIVFAPLGGWLADRVDRRRVLAACDLLQLAGMLALAAVAAAGGSAGLAIGVAGVAAIAGVAASPSLQAALPLLVDERRLASVNALMTSIVSLSMIVGPAVAAFVLLLGSPAIAFGLNAVTFGLSAVCVLAVRSPLGPLAGDAPTEPPAGGSSRIRKAVAELAAGVRVLAARPVTAALVGIASMSLFAYGGQVVLWTLLADTRLGTGTDGLTLIYVAYGVGGLLAAVPASRAASDRSGGAVLAGGAVLGGIAIVALAAVTTLGPGLALVGIQGLVLTVTDVLVITLLQRVLGPAVLGRAVGTMDSLTSIAMIGGSVLAPVIVGAAGLEAAFVVFGIALAVTAAAAAIPIVSDDRSRRGSAEAIAERVRVLGALPLFEGAPRFALEGLASTCDEVIVDHGTAVIREGDAPDFLYVLVDGSATVTKAAAGPEPLTELVAGDVFGEIGLIKRIPRTATVTASARCRLLRIEGEVFLALVSEGVTQPGVLGRSVGLRLARGRGRLRNDP